MAGRYRRTSVPKALTKITFGTGLAFRQGYAARVLRRLGEMFDAPPTEGVCEPSDERLQSDSQTAL